METTEKTFKAGIWQKIEGKILENTDTGGTLLYKLMDTDVSPGETDKGHKILPYCSIRYINDGRFLYATAKKGEVKGMVS